MLLSYNKLYTVIRYIYIYTGEETYHQCSYGDAILCNLELREYCLALLLVDF